MDAVLHESTIHRGRGKLNKAATELELGDVYDTTIERTKAQHEDKYTLGGYTRCGSVEDKSCGTVVASG